jgi:predicted DsbA family dithiol-disulfide isomerase
MLEHSDSTAQAVIDDHNSAIEHGVSAVPTVLINNVLPVPGAQDVDAYETWIKRIIGQTTDDA